MKKNSLWILLCVCLALVVGLTAILTWNANSVTLPLRAASFAKLQQPVQEHTPPVTRKAEAGQITKTKDPIVVLPPGSAGSPARSSLQPQVNPLPALAPAVVSAPPLIRDVGPPATGSATFVPGHFDGIMVSHVPLPEPPRVVKRGTPQTPPTVIHNPPEKGGGTNYLLDATWDTPVFADPTGSSAIVPPGSTQDPGMNAPIPTK